jgi:2-polyprenyl-3-methyl-5-hydroxy-6-metoxy-1,4-benzoquinol methylase
MDENILARYNSDEGADDYLHKFERHWTERVNNWHEQRLIRRLLSSVTSENCKGLALDVPCGYGRLYSTVRDLGMPVVESDWSFPLLAAARTIHARRYGLELAQNYVRATALALPFDSRAFEFVISARLSHHIRASAESGQCLPILMPRP